MKRRRGKYWVRCALLMVFLLMVWVVGWLRLTEPRVAALPALRDGDLVFQTDRTAQMLAIFLATGSLYTHVGLVDISPSGVPEVIEAAGHVREVPLATWVEHGYFRRVTIKRLSMLAPEATARVVAVAQGYEGRPYDVFFRFDQDRIYCSELIFYAYRGGAAVQLGQVQKIETLNMDNFAVRKIVAMRWRRDPTCEAAGVKDFADCFARIMQQEIITPVSLARDPRLETVFSNYGMFGR